MFSLMPHQKKNGDILFFRNTCIEADVYGFQGSSSKKNDVVFSIKYFPLISVI
jgi:hypothetical protein